MQIHRNENMTNILLQKLIHRHLLRSVSCNWTKWNCVRASTDEMVSCRQPKNIVCGGNSCRQLNAKIFSCRQLTVSLAKKGNWSVVENVMSDRFLSSVEVKCKYPKRKRPKYFVYFYDSNIQTYVASCCGKLWQCSSFIFYRHATVN